jgi:O-antigen/teichoic acid export membrane protein
MTAPENPGASEQAPLTTDAGTQTTGASVARGSLWEVAGLVLPQFYVVVASVFVARYLGPSAVGRITLIAFVQFTVTTLLTLGLPLALTRFVGERIGSGKGAEVHVLARRAWGLALIAGFVALATLAAAALLGASPKAAWLFAAITAAGAIMQAIPSAVLRGMQRWREARIVGITSGGIALLLKIVALSAGGGISILFAIDAAIALANLAGTTWLAHRAEHRLPPSSHQTTVFGNLVRFAAIASLNIVISLIVYQRAEVFFLAHFSNDREIAKYSIPFSIVGALLLLSAAVGSALGPAVATLWGAGQVDRIRSGFSRAVRLVLLLNIVIAASSIALGPTAIRLIYGPAFANTGVVFVILVITLPFVPLTALSSSLLLGIGRQWGLTIIGAVAAVLNIGLALAFIPPYGAVGAAIANSLAQLAGSIPLLIYATRLIGGVSLHRVALIRAIATSAAATVAALVVIHELPLVPGFVAGAITFVVVLAVVGVLLRPIIVEDGSWLIELAGSRAHGKLGAVMIKAGKAVVERPRALSPARDSA